MHGVVERQRLLAAQDDAGKVMIVKTVADAGHIGHDGNAVRTKQRRGLEPGQLQKLRRVERTGGDQNLAAGVRGPLLAVNGVADAGGAPSIEQDSGGERIGHHCEIRAAARRIEIGHRRRRAHAVPRRGLVEPRALLGRAVEVTVTRIAALLCRFDIGSGDRMAIAQVGDAERPARAAPVVGVALVVLRLTEVGQHVVVAPAGVALLPPLVEVSGLAADVDQAIDRARSAHHLSARRDDVAAVTFGLRLGLVAPVEAAVSEQLSVAERNAQPRVPAVGARFE